jgi:asparagine synthase (glutamine-hydrolysing)
MCGIAGFTRSASPEGDVALLHRMGEAIAHRGPDAHGEFLDDYVGLAHRRLAIIDLSEDGAQPMYSVCGRYVVVCNGEIYNFQELRAKYAEKGYVFRSRTDTEVILAAYSFYGEACLEQLHGMFAFALWDKQRQTLFLARDRIGKKPLYWWHGGNDRLAFASELKSLLLLPAVRSEIDQTAIVDYLKYLYVPAPKTIYRNIHKLLPGHSLTLRIRQQPVIKEYWDVKFAASDGLDFTAATEHLLDLVRRKTALRMVADVPLGAFLSGGVDSSGIVALMAQHSAESVRTCTIGFADNAFDETSYAREVAKRYGTLHREYQVRENLIETIRVLPKYFDEPFADSSAVPTYHVARLARQAVTVALSGDGGDESFGGYQKYVTEQIEHKVRRTAPRFLLHLLHGLAAESTSGLRKKIGSLSTAALADPGAGFYRTNTFITDRQFDQLLAPQLASFCRDYDPSEYTRRYWDKQQGADHVTRMLYTDLKTYLPGEALVKVDRASMAHALEVRSPLLDHAVVEFAATLPSRWKIVGKQKKIILRHAFSSLLPSDFLARRKQGFAVPLAAWFRNELQALTREMLLENEALDTYFSRSAIARLHQQHLQQREDHGTLLWTLLSFALWQREYRT